MAGTGLQIIGFITLAIAARAAADSFKFCFTRWPATAPMDCNPYGETQTDLYLICKVEAPKNLDIRWFYSENLQSNTENTSAPLQNSTKYLIQTVKTFTPDKVATACRLRVKIVSPGHYWCRAYQDGEVLWPVSQKMDLSNEDSYSRYQSCGTVAQSVKAAKCHYVHVEPSNASSSSSSSTTTTQPQIKAPSTSSSSWLTTITPATNKINNPTVTSTTNIQLQPTSSQRPTTSTNTQRPTNTETQRPTSSNLPRPTQSSLDRGELMGVPDNYEVWLFIVVGLTVLFAVLIVALSIICVGLCVLKSKKAKEEKPISQRGSPHHQRRPSTSMTQQTDLMINCLPDTAIYSTLERDYEDLDDNDEPDTEVATPPSHKQHHYGGELTKPDLPMVPHYSALASDPANRQMHRSPDPDIIEQLTGYGKLDHTKPRQNYNPNTHSPLLSGYRKLEHVSRGFTQSSTSSTLPHSLDGPYANIYPSHIRSSSISGDDLKLKGKIESVNPLPMSPLSNSPRSRGYLNFQVIEEQAASALGNSDSYHMLEDITADKDMLTLQGIDLEVQDYEYLPTVGSEDENKAYDNLTPAVEPTTPVKRALGSYLAKDPLAEQMSVDSTNSGDFTGPFFLPHMLKFGDSMSQSVDQTDSHTYTCLDMATIDPDQKYAVPETQPKRKIKG